MATRNISCATRMPLDSLSNNGGRATLSSLPRFPSANRLAARGLKPVTILAERRSHGDRLKYMAGCRCVRCRMANSRYETERLRARRNGDWNGIVPANRARAHILKLSRLGVGRIAVSIAADVSKSMICAIRSREKKFIRAQSERRILAVTTQAASDHALTSAKRTWSLIARLKSEGYTTKYLADQLGYKEPVLQFGKERVLVRNAWRVERLFQKLTT